MEYLESKIKPSGCFYMVSRGGGVFFLESGVVLIFPPPLSTCILNSCIIFLHTRETFSVHTVCVALRRPRGDAKKCRKVYGMNHREQWCTQCKWKKACTRFGENNWDNNKTKTISMMTRFKLNRWWLCKIERMIRLNWASGDSNLNCFQISHTDCVVSCQTEGVSSKWKVPLVPSSSHKERREQSVPSLGDVNFLRCPFYNKFQEILPQR